MMAYGFGWASLPPKKPHGAALVGPRPRCKRRQSSQRVQRTGRVQNDRKQARTLTQPMDPNNQNLRNHALKASKVQKANAWETSWSEFLTSYVTNLIVCAGWSTPWQQMARLWAFQRWKRKWFIDLLPLNAVPSADSFWIKEWRSSILLSRTSSCLSASFRAA